MLTTMDVVGGYGSVQILNGVSLKVARGQIVALLGGNGTGKSTMLKALSGPDQAVERLDRVRRRAHRRHAPGPHRAARPRAGHPGQGGVSGDDRRGEPAARRAREAGARGCAYAGSSARTATSRSSRSGGANSRHALRWPAADALHRARPDVGAEDDAAGRTLRRARAAGGPRHLPRNQPESAAKA